MIKQLIPFVLAPMVFWAPPVHSTGTITLTGQVQPLLYFSGGPDVQGSSASLSPDANPNPTASGIFNGLQNDANPNESCTFGMRVRGNSPCHVGASVSNYTVSNMSYQGNPLTGLGSELSFVKVGSGSISAGANGNSTGASFGPRFLGGSTLANLNGGVVGPVSSSSDTFFSCPKAPSNSGTISSPDNWVQAEQNFSIPTGLGWQSTDGTNAGSWSVVIQEQVYPGP